jgi:magnesium transporter
MNFRNLPGIEWVFGFFSVMIVLVIMVRGMLVYFRKKKWV